MSLIIKLTDLIEAVVDILFFVGYGGIELHNLRSILCFSGNVSAEFANLSSKFIKKSHEYTSIRFWLHNRNVKK